MNNTNEQNKLETKYETNGPVAYLIARQRLSATRFDDAQAQRVADEGYYIEHHGNNVSFSTSKVDDLLFSALDVTIGIFKKDGSTQETPYIDRIEVVDGNGNVSEVHAIHLAIRGTIAFRDPVRMPKGYRMRFVCEQSPYLIQAMVRGVVDNG